MPDNALSEIARQAPYAAALLVLSIGYGSMLWKFIQSANARMDSTELRHSSDRQAQEDRWLDRVHNISSECHDAQDRASDAIEKMAISSSETALALNGLNAKLDTVITIARQAG